MTRGLFSSKLPPAAVEPIGCEPDESAAPQLCSFSESCFGLSFAPHALMAALRKVARGSRLVREGDEFRNLFCVRSGFFKTVVMTSDGREHVTGFQMGGDLIGFDGIAFGRYTSDIVALENSQVCVLPYDRIRAEAARSPGLHDQLHGIMARELVRNHAVMLMLGRMKAEERVAVFVLDLLERLRSRGWSSSEAVLRMSRGEIGSYLGLTLETVSRALSVLRERGLIRVKQRHIEVLDVERLRAFSTGAPARTPMRRHRASGPAQQALL